MYDYFHRLLIIWIKKLEKLKIKKNDFILHFYNENIKKKFIKNNIYNKKKLILFNIKIFYHNNFFILIFILLTKIKHHTNYISSFILYYNF